MCASVLADLPGCSVATTSTCTAKLECLDKIRTCGRSCFENEFLEEFFSAFQRNNYLLTNLKYQIFRQTMVHYFSIYGCQVMAQYDKILIPFPASPE